jgi:FkbM family methyltransferase
MRRQEAVEVVELVSRTSQSLNRVSRAIRYPPDVRSHLARIDSLQIEPNLKDRIKRTYLDTIVRRRYDSKDLIANILGYQVRFCRFESLALLFDEIFLSQNYSFVSDRKDPFIIDCGSNIGMSILYFKIHYPDSEILAFEPEEHAFACLAANVERNGLRSVRINMKALWKNEEDVVLFTHPDKPGSLTASVIRRRFTSGRPALATRLSAWIDKPVDLLKIDVEGAEGAILEDLVAAGKHSLVKQMIIEFHHHIEPQVDSLSTMLQTLENGGFGYQIHGGAGLPFRPQQFQDILVYAYRKND